ncbi:DUF441 domain-containing protein [Ligilactobacillus cholophilus]|uniref:DUF441 domain-containing protein n=1 Tax=Ligilactobacillus cholophilus TaxID=3050131 RepID=UPI0025AFB6DC|nr:DUF441 domain-containing protein [Ligilactobacillus cholophilus]
MESWLFLFLILAVAMFGKNTSLIVATVVVMLLKLLPFASKFMETVHDKGINWGVTIISISILIPIATGEISIHDLVNIVKSPAGWIAIGCGILVAILSKWGVDQLSISPQVTVALVFGTILGVVLFKGIAAGPVIASGITYVIVTLLHLSF